MKQTGICLQSRTLVDQIPKHLTQSKTNQNLLFFYERKKSSGLNFRSPSKCWRKNSRITTFRSSSQEAKEDCPSSSHRPAAENASRDGTHDRNCQVGETSGLSPEGRWVRYQVHDLGKNIILWTSWPRIVGAQTHHRWCHVCRLQEDEFMHKFEQKRKVYEPAAMLTATGIAE